MKNLDKVLKVITEMQDDLDSMTHEKTTKSINRTGYSYADEKVAVHSITIKFYDKI